LLTHFASTAGAITIASDSAADPAYAAEVDGAWKGENPGANQNPPGNDNGGFGFLPWDFNAAGSFHMGSPPYGILNHFIDGVDFPTTTFNNLSAPAFGLGNENPAVFDTTVAIRPFAQPLAVGDVFSAEIDSPAEYDDYTMTGFPFAIIGFRDAAGIEAFNIEAGSSVPFGDFNWRYDDLNKTNGDFGVDAGATSIAPTDTSDGSTFSLEVLSPTTGRFTFDGKSLDITFGHIDQVDGPVPAGPPAAVFFTLFDNNAEADSMGNPTGEHAFYFDNLKIERPAAEVTGDYNGNGTVDAADYVMWRDTLNQAGMNLPADGNNNNMIDAGDYDVWRSRFGRTSGVGSATNSSVPEPTSLTLLLFGTLAAVARRRMASRR
jgi:hypothetical protein